MSDPTIIEEPWLEITTRTGLTMLVPAPMDPLLQNCLRDHDVIKSSSQITRMNYYVRLSEDILFIRQFTRKHEPERLERAKVRAQSPTGRTPSSGSSPMPSSSSAPTGKRGTNSPGKSTSVTIH